MRLKSLTTVGWLGVASLVALSGCTCETTETVDAAFPFDVPLVQPDAFVPEAELTISPPLADFGDVVVGQTSTATEFEIENVGTGQSAALSATFGGSGAGDFTFASNDCAGERLAPGATCTISVTFRPGDTGGSSATLTVAGGDVSAVATLSGNGAEDAGLTISPSPHNYGDVIVGESSAPQSFTVTNTGDATSGTITISVGGLDATQFTLGADTCSDTTIDAGETCTVEVVYAPTASGTHMGTVQASASPGSTATAALQGRAATEADLRLRPGAQDFGSVVTGSSSTDVTFTLENIGGVASDSVSHSFTGADASEFSVVSSTCAGAPLDGGDTCTIVVRFNAGTAGAKVASLDVTAGTITVSAALTANGVTPGSIIFEPPTREFGTSAVGSATGATTFTLRNTGGSATTAITVAVAGTNPADFPIVAGGDGCSGAVLPALGTCTVAVQFNPTASGRRAATLRAQTASGTPATAALGGDGESPSVLSVTPTASDFGSVPTGATSSSVEFTVTNTGTAASGVPAISLTGVQSTQWSIFSNGCTASLAGGASCSVFLRFSPTTTGVKTAVLNVSGTPGGSDTADLSGTGITPAAVVLSPNPADFGSPSEDLEFTERTFTLSNSGMGPAAISAVTISGPDAAEFSVVPGGTCGATLAGGPSNCTIVVRYSPQDQGASAASLDVTVAPGGLLSSALTGTGDPDLQITPPVTNNFTASNGGTGVIVGETATNDYIITNRTTLAAAFTGLTVASPTGMMEYTRVTGFGGDCGATLAAGASCTVRIRFAPLASGGAGTRNVNLTVNATASSGAATETFAITGTARGAVRWVSSQVTTPSEALNTIPAGTAATATFGTRNIGGNYNVTLTLRNDSASSVFPETTGAFTGDMNIINDNCSGSSLAAGATCTVLVRFYPRTPGAADSSGTVTVTSTGVGASIAITGTKIAGANVTVSPGASGTANVTFPTTIATRTSAPTVFTITNTGAVTSGTLGYNLVASPRYAISATTCPATGTRGLNGGESCTISVTFTPSQADQTNTDIFGSLSISAGTTINTTLVGRASSQLTLTPSTLVTLTTASGTTSPAQSYTLANVGTTNIPAITLVSTDTGGTPAFDITFPTNTCTGALNAGTSCTFSIVYSAGAAVVGTFDREIRASNGAYALNSARVAVAPVRAVAQNPAAFTITPNFDSVAPGDILLGRMLIGTAGSTLTYTVRNVGDVASGPVTASIPLFSPFSCFGNPTTSRDWAEVVSTTCSGPLAAGATCTVGIRGRAPMGEPNCNATFFWQVTDGAATATSNIRVLSTGSPSAFATPTVLDFGAVVTSTASAEQTITVTNGAASNITVNAAPAPTAPFTLVAGSNNCTPTRVLAPGDTCTYRVTFNPTAAGFFQQEIVVQTTAPFFGRTNVIGSGVAAPGLNVTPADVAPDFANTVAGQSSTITYTVTNTGGVSTATAPAVTIGGADPSQFTVPAATNRCTAALTAAGTGATSSCSFDVVFSPTGAGARSAVLNINAGGAATHTRTLTGTGIGAALLGISPSAPQTCPSRPVGTGSTDFSVCTTYTISNGGGSTSLPLSLSVTPDFLIQDSSTCVNPGGSTGLGTLSVSSGQTLAAGGTCTVIVQFAPQSVLGARTGTLTVRGGAGVADVTGTISSIATSGLQFTGVAPGFTAATDTVPAIMDFGSVARGSFQARTPRVTNATSPTTGSLSYTITGANAADFDVIGDAGISGGTLGPTGSATFNIRFLPSGTGTRTATLTVTDGTTQKTTTITLTGTGT